MVRIEDADDQHDADGDSPDHAAPRPAEERVRDVPAIQLPDGDELVGTIGRMIEGAIIGYVVVGAVAWLYNMWARG